MTPAEFIVHALTERGLTIACAETLTGGGTKEKPVGMVCFSVKTPGGSITRTCFFGNLGRNVIMDRSVQTALELVTEHLES